MEVYVARQPIFDASKRVGAYELLYRSGRTGGYDAVDGNQATASVLVNAFVTIGVEAVTGGRNAFINFTRDMILSGAATALPAKSVTLELLEQIEPDDDVVAACRQLKTDGYKLAVDDVVADDAALSPFFELADVVKVDFMDASPAAAAGLARRLGSRGVTLLAEKIETESEFQQAVAWGYTLFQGYFFAKPELVEGRAIPGVKLNYLRLLQEIHSSSSDFDRLETVIRSDPSLSYQLLRLVNSAAFPWRGKVDSIRGALVALGAREVRKWASLICLSGLAHDKPHEVVVQSVIRAHFAEALAPLTGLADRQADLFLMGLFSLIDAIIDRPLEEAVEELPLASDVIAALTDGDSPLTGPLELVTAYERGDWSTLALLAEHYSMTGPQMPSLYLTAVRAADALLKA